MVKFKRGFQNLIKKIAEKKVKCSWVKRNLLLTILTLFFSGFLMLLTITVDGFAQWYSTSIYPFWVNTIGRLFGLAPFSVAEMLLYLIVVLFLGSIVFTTIKIISRKEKILWFFRWLTSIIMIMSFLMLSFILNAGINYHRDSFAQISGLEVEEYSVEELLMVANWLTVRVNETGKLVPRNERGEMVLTVDVASTSVEAMRSLGNDFPILYGYYPPPKPIQNSWLLSIMQVSGIYIPFTIEGNYNRDMPSHNIPFTATHELAHVRGFMQEEEANFIAFLACIRSEKVEFQYSGYLLAWVYVRNALRRIDSDAATELNELLYEGVSKDLQANRTFWAQFEGPVSDLQTRINDAYLRANAQPEGVRSYGMMVDLVIAYYFDFFQIKY